MSIYAKTPMETMPGSCTECKFGERYGCVGDVECKILNEYFTGNVEPPYKERPDACPLVNLWIYQAINAPDGDFEKKMEKVENALGFRLFAWQKTYIAYGEFRQYGATTAKILRDLLDVSAEPIDYTMGAATHRQQFYWRELRKIKEKLDRAGIPTRAVFFSERDKRKEW